MIGLRFDKNAFTLTIMKILVTLIVIATPHVIVNPKEEKPKQTEAIFVKNFTPLEF